MATNENITKCKKCGSSLRKTLMPGMYVCELCSEIYTGVKDVPQEPEPEAEIEEQPSIGPTQCEKCGASLRKTNVPGRYVCTFCREIYEDKEEAPLEPEPEENDPPRFEMTECEKCGASLSKTRQPGKRVCTFCGEIFDVIEPPSQEVLYWHKVKDPEAEERGIPHPDDVEYYVTETKDLSTIRSMFWAFFLLVFGLFIIGVIRSGLFGLL